MYRRRDSNSQKTVSKTAASSYSATSAFVNTKYYLTQSSTSIFLDLVDSWETVRNPKSCSFPELLYFVEQIRVERIPLVLQTNVHTTYTTAPNIIFWIKNFQLLLNFQLFCWLARTRTWTKRVKVSYANQLHHKSIWGVFGNRTLFIRITIWGFTK